MNKTVSVNISGFIFHIEEQGYEILKKYLQTIRGYFKDTKGGDEIMVDVEARIAEMFQERTKNRQVVELQDVEEVISIMGKPEAFIEEAPEPNQSSQKSQEPQPEMVINPKTRRIYRDPDDKVIGGVCSGISAYFDIDPIWIRIGFAVAFFGYGTGLLVYILLWIIIPKARTTAEKLEMKGENVNLSNIEKSIKEELEGVKKKFQDISGEAKTINKSGAAHSIRAFFEKLAYFIAAIVKSFAKVVGKIVGIILVIIGIIAFMILMGIFFGNEMTISIQDKGVTLLSLSDLAMVFFNSPGQFFKAKIALWILLGVPALMLMYNGGKLLLGIKKHIKWLKYAWTIAWFIGFAMAGLLVYEIGKDFSAKAVQKTSFPVTPSGNTLTLKMDDSGFMEDEDGDLIIIKDEKGFLPDVKLDILKSKSDSMYLQMDQVSRGRTKKDAISRAENINYNFRVKDSTLLFSNHFLFDIKEKYRGQKLRLKLFLPEGTVIFMDEGLEDFIYDIENTTNTFDDYMLGRRWKMGASKLECVDCEDLDRDEKERDEDDEKEGNINIQI